ncbi:MAG: holo-ACP synthase [Candidatus Aminicenantes bacterium]|nr:holo-ACP synthase [Candidatus Aminicenantes bacterium]
MIVGIGTDIIEVARIKKLIDGQERFKKRIFTASEIAYCERKKNKAQNYAARFAAKEAFLKAIGTGLRQGISFKEIEVVNNEHGKPEIFLYGTAKEFTLKMGVTNIQVSLSHLGEMAVAVVTAETQRDASNP